MSIIIPAAGLSSRMKDEGSKALLEINGEPLIKRQIRLLEYTFPGATITVVVGHQAEKVCAILGKCYPSVCIVQNELFQYTNVARSLYLGMIAAPAEHTIVVYGDLVFGKNFVLELASDFYLANARESLLLTNTGHARSTEVGCTSHSDGTLINMDYGLKEKWCHAGYLLKSERDAFIKIAGKPESRKLFSYEIFNKMIDDGADIKTRHCKKIQFVEIDRQQDLANARSVFAEATP